MRLIHLIFFIWFNVFFIQASGGTLRGKHQILHPGDIIIYKQYGDCFIELD